MSDIFSLYKLQIMAQLCFGKGGRHPAVMDLFLTDTDTLPEFVKV